MIPFVTPYPAHLGRFLAVALAMTMTLPAQGADLKDVRHSDLWLQATLVTTYALNEHLDPLRIDVDVEHGLATLSGSVDSDVQRDLAGELAAGVDGIKQVNNELQVQPDEAKASGETPGFREYVRDANITVRFKSRLLWDAETQGLQINVDTRDGVVRLSGKLPSQDAIDKAIRETRRIAGVKEVTSELRKTGEES